MRGAAALLLFACASAQAGEVTVIRPKPFIADEETYYVTLDGQGPQDIDSREHVRLFAAPGKHVLAVECPKANSRSYAETRLEHDFGDAPAFFVISPKFDCVAIEAVDAPSAARLLGSSTLHPASQPSSFEPGKVEASAALATVEGASAAKAAAAPGDVAALTAAWVEAFNSRDATRLAALYDPDAVLIGTSAKQPALGKAAIAAYFRDVATRPTGRVAPGEHSLRVYGDTAIDSGLYTFFEMRDGAAVMTPARYSFVYRRRGGKWLIVEHHSSRVP